MLPIFAVPLLFLIFAGFEYTRSWDHYHQLTGQSSLFAFSSERLIGLSKLGRVVEMFARDLQIQERLTTQIAETIMEYIKPQGVGVIIEAKHLCMIMRGVEKQNSVAVTSAMLGVFKDCDLTRAEFLRLVREKS